MKVRIAYTVEASDHLRYAIAHRYGERRLATRKEVRRWFEESPSATDDLIYDYEYHLAHPVREER